ncbi:hypothetical protein D3C76_1552530 [compost metagenome]
MAEMLAKPGLQTRRITRTEVQSAGIGEQPMGLQRIGHRRVAGQQAALAHLPATQATDAQCQQQHRSVGPVPLPTPTQFTPHMGRIKPWVGGLPGIA